MSNEQIVLTTEEARQATGHKLNFRVLVRSMVLTIIAFSVIGYVAYTYYGP